MFPDLKILSIILVTIGTVYMAFSIVVSVKTNKNVPPELKTKWYALTCLMASFLLGYIAFIAIQTQGYQIPLELFTSAIFLGGAIFVYLVITLSRITINKITLSKERYSLAQKAARIGSWDWDILTGKLEWSEQIEPLFGFRKGEFGGDYDSFISAVHEEDRQHVINAVNAALDGIKEYAIEHRIVWPNGEIKWVAETGDVVRAADGSPVRMVGIVSDITDRKILEEKLYYTSITDELTGLHNRRGFFSLAQQFLNSCERENCDIFLLFIDLDNLKPINDKFGHDAGDSLIIATGKILKSVFRKSDIIGRIGGDEFVSITKCDTGACSNDILINRIEQRLHEHNEGLEPHQMVHFSYGIVKYDRNNPCSIEELTSKADKLMYADKKQKKKEALRIIQSVNRK